MAEFVKYDPEERTLRIKYDQEFNLDSLSKIKERADGIGMLSRIAIGSLRTLIGMQQAALESRLSEIAEEARKMAEETKSKVPKKEIEEKPEEIETEEETEARVLEERTNENWRY